MTYEQLLQIIRQTGSPYKYPNFSLDVPYLAQMNLAFSSTGEDLWLRQFMKPKLRAGIPGFYVDLGANDPVLTSATFLFYCYGWRGICIDANPRYRESFQRHRPRDTFINAAISDLGASLYFAEHKRALTMSQVRLDRTDFGEEFLPAVKVPALTMADVLETHLPKGTVIDFMLIDIEGSELPALRSNDWAIYKPRVILIEIDSATFDPLSPQDFPTIDFLRFHGYRYEGCANNNVLMTGPNFKD